MALLYITSQRNAYVACNGFNELITQFYRTNIPWVGYNGFRLNEDHSQQELVRKSPRSQRKTERKSEKRSSKSGSSSAMKASSSASSDKKITCKDQKMHREALLKLVENTELYYNNNGKTKFKGWKQGRKILCGCCSKEVSPSQFEAHAGMGSHKKPYGNIYLPNGVSLHEYALTLQPLHEQPKNNDKLCEVCSEGGSLLCCYGCPILFHKECVSEYPNSRDKWYCIHCWNSALVVEQMAIDQIACAICREYDFEDDNDVFNERTVIVCDQCEKEYHVGCLWEQGIAQLQQLPPGKWFCSSDCSRLHNVLGLSVAYGPQQIPDRIKYIHREKLQNSRADSISDIDVRWVVVRGNEASEDQKSLLAEAFEIFHECFDPIIDSVTGKDYIPAMIYGKTLGDLDFGGVHCAMLLINSHLVTAGLFRALGHDIVELSVAATRRPYQRKGYFRIFFTCFKTSLEYLKIKKIVVPAVEDLKGMWIGKFGFREVTAKQLFEYRRARTSMVRFSGTTLLERGVPKSQYTYENDGL